MVNKSERIVAFINKAYLNGSGNTKPPFSIQLNGSKQIIGDGQPAFNLVFKNKSGINALASMDDTKILEAYMAGDIDVEGEMIKAFELRGVFKDFHPLQYLWLFIQPLFFGQVRSDRKWIAQHYDLDENFFLAFLDKKHRCYSHGVFASEDETLEEAITHKMDYAISSTGIKAGDNVLEIGSGWGAFVEYAGSKDIRVTSLTISKESESYVSNLIAEKKLPCKVVRQHFFEHTTSKPYDAIINMGVTEHLPDYAQTLKKYQGLLKPGGYVYLDACGSRTKYGFHSFMYRYIFPGNCSPLCLHDYLEKLSKTKLELIEVLNDRNNYRLTTKWWAENLERNREFIVSRWNESLFRRFQIYLWGCVDVFQRDLMQAYRVVLRNNDGLA